MNTDSNLLGWIEPPDHGLNELKGKIARRTARKKTVAGITATALVVFAAIGIFNDGIRFTAPDAPRDRDWQAAISTPKETLRVINGAALELSAPDAETRIYLVSTVPQEPSSESG